MKGFIKKDILMMRSNLKILLVLFVLYIVMDFQGNSSLSFFLPVCSVVSMLSTFSYDDYNHWTSYAVTLPNGRRNVVKSKYITTFILLFLMSLCVGVFSSIIYVTKHYAINFSFIFENLFGSIVGALFVLDFMYPMIFKMGIEKARIAIFVGVFSIIILGGILIKYVDVSALSFLFSFFHGYGGILIFIIMMIFLSFLSYQISMLFYRKKEF